MPARGVSAYTKVPLGPSWLDASCLASAPDGSDWVLASGTGYPSRLIHVTAAGPVQTLVLARTVQVADGSNQCLTVAPDGDLWFPLADGDIAEFDRGPRGSPPSAFPTPPGAPRRSPPAAATPRW